MRGLTASKKGIGHVGTPCGKVSPGPKGSERVPGKSVFSRELANYLDDDEYGDLQQYLINCPEAGDIIPGSGGVRKLRWKRRGMGKRGGVRIIYYVMKKRDELWMLALYAKSAHDNIPAHIVRAMKERF